MKIKLLNLKTKKQEDISDKNIIDALYYNTHKIINPSHDISDYISNIEGKIPMYDIYTYNLYLIQPDNLYYRVTYNHYRFPTHRLLTSLDKEISELKSEDIITTRQIGRAHV